MKQKIEIKGVIAFNADKKKYEFIDYIAEKSFKKGVYKTEYSNLVFIQNHVLTVDIPSDMDLIKPQLAALDEKEKELTFQYNQALQHIKVERNNLLAIEGK